MERWPGVGVGVGVGVTVAGVKLNNNTALTHKAKEKWIPGHESNCGWSETLQQHSTDNTKRTKFFQTRNLSNFRGKIRK
jgi:hypothetical protein